MFATTLLFFAEVVTAIHLRRALQVFMAGTCRPRLGLPPDLLTLTSPTLDFIERGDMVWRHTKEMTFVSWYTHLPCNLTCTLYLTISCRLDKKLVKFLCTMPHLVDQVVLIKRKSGRKARGEAYKVQTMFQPACIYWYNKLMGGYVSFPFSCQIQIPNCFSSYFFLIREVTSITTRTTRHQPAIKAVLGSTFVTFWGVIIYVILATSLRNNKST